MVVIFKDTTNRVKFNLAGKKNIGTNPYIFVKLVNDMTKEAYYLYPTEIVTPRFSELRIVEGVDVNLGAKGFYTYTIYQVDANDLTNDTGLEDNIIERGKALVKDNSVTEVSYTEYTPTSNKNTTNNNTQYISI
jgi:hypothetical protein